MLSGIGGAESEGAVETIVMEVLSVRLGVQMEELHALL
jgi:hypothetical protein